MNLLDSKYFICTETWNEFFLLTETVKNFFTKETDKNKFGESVQPQTYEKIKREMFARIE